MISAFFVVSMLLTAPASLASEVVHRVEPAYPALAQQAGIQGIVVVEVAVDREGLPGGMRVLRGNPMLYDAAVTALRQWRWKPTLIEGSAQSVVVERVEFFLGERERAIGLTEIVRDRGQVSEDRMDAIRRIAALPPKWRKIAASTLEKAQRDADAAVAAAAKEALAAFAATPVDRN